MLMTISTDPHDQSVTLDTTGETSPTRSSNTKDAPSPCGTAH
ncbi:putative cytochrome P450 [Mycobacterium xenopi 3993]|nr:putative cytochrome P450 [Mycobacterium xenopi 3993]